MSYNKKGKKGKQGRKSRLRDINDEIMAQLSIEETGTEQMSSNSSESSIVSFHSSTELGTKTATFILEEMIINSNSSQSKKKLTQSSHDDKSASKSSSSSTYSTTITNTAKNYSDDNASGKCDTK
ncbi:hypothetical protein LOAG_15074, partial [Loa loa]